MHYSFVNSFTPSLNHVPGIVLRLEIYRGSALQGTSLDEAYLYIYNISYLCSHQMYLGTWIVKQCFLQELFGCK